VNFIIEFEVLVINTGTNNIYDIFLLKKNVKIILGYLPIVILEILKEWKMVITLVEQEYKSTKER